MKTILLIVLFSILACSEYTDNQLLVKSQKAIRYEYTSGVRDTVGIIHKEEKYDSAGNIFERIYYDDGIIASKVIKKYDSKNNLIEESHNNADGLLKYKILHSYNDEGKKIETKYLVDD